jgi:formylmethanofuran dehydrogenase subunit E
MRNPELACDWCGDEVPNGEGVAVDDDRVCPECAEGVTA